MSFTYVAYCLTIESEFALPALTETLSAGEPRAGEADIVIRQGTVPAQLENPAGQGALYQATPGRFLLTLDGIARYLVRNGSEIIVEPAPGALESDIGVFILSSCFGALLHQRGKLVLHAAAVDTSAGAVLFCGRSGNGKSALLGELLRRGYFMMADDLSVMETDITGTPLVLPSFPRMCLWADTVEMLAMATTELQQLRSGLQKYEYQVPDHFRDRVTALHRIYLLSTTNMNQFSISQLPLSHAFNAILKGTYRRDFLVGLGVSKSHFALAASVAAATRIVRIDRPRGGFRLRELADLVERDLADG